MVGHCSFTYLCNTHLAHESIHNVTVTVAGTRQNICRARYYAISPARPSVCPFMDQSKTVAENYAIFTVLYSSPMLLVFVA